MENVPGAKVLRRGLVGVFILAVPLFLVTASVAWAVNDLRFYSYEFDKRDIPLVTGIEKDELMSLAHQVRGYFNSTQESVDIRATIYGEERELFNTREVLHMEDVKQLIWGVYILGGLSLLFMVTYGATGLLMYGRSFGRTVGHHLLWGSIATILFVLTVGFVALVGFDSLFLTFHELSFANDFWRLDSRTDYLVMMFPNGFWYDATLYVGILAVGGAVLLGGASGTFLWLARKERRTNTASKIPGASLSD